MSGFQKFREFVSNSTIVNDPAEHVVALLSNFRGVFQEESLCQNGLICVAENRKLLTRDSKQEDKLIQMKKKGKQ